ncbi:MAG: DnaJ domain-containing protein [Polyangiales bacterium]
MNDTLKPTTEGSFLKTPLANVLLYAREKRLTGTLVVHIEPEDEALRAVLDVAGASRLVFEDGRIAAVELPRVVDNLAWVLREMELISDEVFAKAQEAIDAGADEVATVLRLRAVDPLKLDAALREQARRKVLALFGFPDGRYAYYNAVDLLDGAHRLRTPEDVFPIVWRSYRDHRPDESAVRGVLEKVGGRFIRLRDGHEFDRFEFGDDLGTAPTQLRVAPSSIEQLVGLGKDPGLVRAMVYLLALTKQVEAMSPATAIASQSMAPRSLISAAPPRDAVPSIAPPMNADLTGGAGAVISGPAPMIAAEPAAAATPAEPAAEAAAEPEADAPAAAEAPAAPPAESGENDPRFKAAKVQLHRMEHWTYYEMLDLKPSASQDEIRSAYTRLATQYHPDRAPIPELKSLYTEIFALFNAAFGTLNNPKGREQYDESIAGGGGTPAAQKQVQAVLETVQDTHRAELMVKRRDWVEAEKILRRVVAVSPDDISANLMLAQCLLQIAPQQHFKDIVVMLRKVIDTTENNDKAHYLMGMALKTNNDKRAMGLFKMALEMNPNNVEALREVRLFEMRKEKKREEANSVSNQINSLFDRFRKR